MALVVHHSNWMSTLNGDLSVAAISIPGTHDTCARYGGSLVACQTWSLPDQLRAGIRFLDIRCRPYGNNFAIHHESFFQEKWFDQVLDDVFGFLREHPREFVLMRIKEEYERETNCTRSFEDLVIGFLSRGPFYTESDIPTVGEARGKVIILRNFNASSSPLGIYWGSLKCVTDAYEVNSLSIGDVNLKWESVKGGIEGAQRGSKSDMYVTFSSGVSPYGLAYPNAVADRINKRLFDFLCGFSGTGRLGIIAMDFPGLGMIDKIIGNN